MANMNPPNDNNKDSNLDAESSSIRHDYAEDRTVSSRKRLRDQLNNEVEKFLLKGGKIDKVDPHVTADPPKKPNSSYGSRPI